MKHCVLHSVFVWATASQVQWCFLCMSAKGTVDLDG